MESGLELFSAPSKRKNKPPGHIRRFRPFGANTPPMGKDSKKEQRVVAVIAAALIAGVGICSAGTSKIAFSGEAGIHVVNPDGSDATLLVPEVGTSTPSWSPDGTKIAFIVNRAFTNSIWTVNSDGSNPRVLLSQGKDEGLTCHFTTTTERCENYPVYGNSVWSVHGLSYLYLDSDIRVNVCLLSKQCSQIFAYDFDFTPDGRVVYMGNHVGIADNLFSSQPTVRDFFEVEGGHAGIAVSRDGLRIAYTDADGLSVMETDGSNRVLLVEDRTLLSPSWSPDGTEIAYLKYSSDGAFIHLVSVDGGNPRIILGLSGLGYLDWSPFLDVETSVTPISWGALKRKP